MQVFRLVGGHVDKIIAFDELPERFVEGLEMKGPDGMTPGWKKWLPVKVRRWPGASYILQSGAVKVVPDRFEEGPFFYILEYQAINRDIERWQEICAFVRRAVDLTVRLPDKLEDMAIPLAADFKSEITVHDPATEVPVIKIPEALQEKTPPLVSPQGEELRPVPPPAPPPLMAQDLAAKVEVSENVKCPKCAKEFTSKRALQGHQMKGHIQQTAAA